MQNLRLDGRSFEKSQSKLCLHLLFFFFLPKIHCFVCEYRIGSSHLSHLSNFLVTQAIHFLPVQVSRFCLHLNKQMQDPLVKLFKNMKFQTIVIVQSLCWLLTNLWSFYINNYYLFRVELKLTQFQNPSTAQTIWTMFRPVAPVLEISNCSSVM